MRKYPRIEIDQLAYDGLQIEAVLQHKTPREIATKAILGYISEKALSAIDHTTDRPQDHKTSEDKADAGAVDDLPHLQPQKRRKLADNPDALQQIKTLWQGGEHNAAQIAKAVGYPRGTVWENIKKMKEKGELASE
jgi:hypothetical protein